MTPTSATRNSKKHVEETKTEMSTALGGDDGQRVAKW